MSIIGNSVLNLLSFQEGISLQRVNSSVFLPFKGKAEIAGFKYDLSNDINTNV